MDLNIPVPGWATPLLPPARYKGAKGGRSSGKSHFMAEQLVKRHIRDPGFSSVCVREIQRSLKFSAKRLIESKIEKFGVEHLFEITQTEIRRVGGRGVIIFQGLQDHTAESIKSLEDFDLALVEEAQSLSQRSLELLLPTIRKEGSEVWFIWNPQNADDPVDQFLVANPPLDAVVVHVNYLDNPFLPEVSRDEANEWQRRDPDSYAHVWLGEYNILSEDQVLAGRWCFGDFEPYEDWDGPYFGSDFGFATDPTTLVECWIFENKLYIYRELYEHAVETDHLPAFYDQHPYAAQYVIRADNARPENISYLQRHGYERMESVKKWPGSIEDGISKLRSFDEIVIHTQCIQAGNEARLWKYKRDRLTGDIKPEVLKGNDHIWDAVRYAIQPIIKSPRVVRVAMLEEPYSNINHYPSCVG